MPDESILPPVTNKFKENQGKAIQIKGIMPVTKNKEIFRRSRALCRRAMEALHLKGVPAVVLDGVRSLTRVT